jgi:rod shape-determining protein MreB
LMLLSRIQGMFSTDLAIDLGTANTLIYAVGKGIVLNEPSVVAIRQKGSAGGKEIAAVGEQTRQILGRTPQNITAIRPLKEGVISDFAVTEKMLEYFIHKVHKTRMIRTNPRALICVPCGATQVQRRTIKEVVAGAGAREVFVIEEPLAAAMGAGLPVDEARGSMVVDIGGGASQVAVVCLNGIVYANAVHVGGHSFDDAIVAHARRNHGMLIGESTAERVKLEIGFAFPGDEVRTIEVYGRNLAEGIPRKFTLNSVEILEAFQEPLASIIDVLKTALDQIPPDLGADVAEKGIMLTGGGALLRDIDRLLQEETDLPVLVAEDPLTCVARGSGRALEMTRERGLALFARA